MKKTKGRKSILWVETAGFLLLIVLSWLTEIFRIPYYIFHEPFVPNWDRAILRTVVLLLIWGWVYWLTWRLLKRLHYLEEFLRICSWCRRVCDHEEWLALEDFFNTRFSTRTSHGMCPDCLRKKVIELAQSENPPATPQNPK